MAFGERGREGAGERKGEGRIKWLFVLVYYQVFVL